MYLMGQSSLQGPGTVLAQRIPWSAAQESQLSGMGCAGGCECGGSCGRAGLGLFDSMDFSTWGIGEWGVIGVGTYLLMSIVGDTKRAGRAISRKAKGVRRGIKA